MNISEVVEIAIASMGGTAVALVTVGVLGKSLVGQLLKKDMKVFQAAIEDSYRKGTKLFEAGVDDSYEKGMKLFEAGIDDSYKKGTKLFEAGVDDSYKKGMKLFESEIDHRRQTDLRRLESELAAKVKLIELKLPVYRELWCLSAAFQASEYGNYTVDHLVAREEDLRGWYYGGAGAMLSFSAQNHVQAGLRLLRSRSPDDSAVLREVFSALRTQLKLDIGVYSPEEAKNALSIDQVISDCRERARENRS